MNQDDVPCSEQDQGKVIRDVHLVKMSVFLAFFLEVIPLEADILFQCYIYKDFPHFLALKLFFLTLIFLPLLIYVKRNGLYALKYVQGRVTIVAMIVVFNMVLQCIYWVQCVR